MKNLVSKNPVQRFKQGRKIEKMQLGRILGATGNFVDEGFNYASNLLRKVPLVGGVWGAYDDAVQNTMNKVFNNNSTTNSTGSTKNNHKLAAPGVDEYIQKVSSNKSRNSSKKNSIVSDKSSGISKKYGFAGDIDRNWRGTKGVIGADDLKLLQEMGFKGKTAQEAQDYMNNQFANNGLFGYKVENDNAWGGQSNRALQALYKAWKERQEIKPTTVEKPSPTIQIQLPQTPTLQRQAISDYSNYAQNLKQALGGNNNFSGLSNLVWKEYADNDNSFAANFSRDMRSRFNNYKTLQDWLSNQQAIENALNISGRYRGSRAGDYGDISRSMANWAGGYNYNIDKQNQQALNNYNALVNKYKKALGSYKQGGQLPSRNVVERFKQRNFR